MGFVTVTAEQARESRYYGLDGWLLIFYVYAAMSAVSSAAMALPFSPFEQFLHFDIDGLRLLAAIRAISLLPFLILAPMKHRMMPIAVITGEWINTAFTAVLTPSVWTSIFEGMSRFMVTIAEQGTATPDLGPAMNQFNAIAETFLQFAIWQAIFVGIAMTALFTWYLLASKRVNVTYRHRLNPDEP